MNYFTDFEDIHLGLIDNIKESLYHRHNNIFDRLDFEDDNIYQEPLLYCYLTQNDDKWLDSIIYGYEKQKKTAIEVFSNFAGEIYIPNIGYFKTNKPHRTFVLKTTNEQWQLALDGNSVQFSFEPLSFLQCGIEIVKYQHPLLETIFTLQQNKLEDIILNDITPAHLQSFDQAVEIIAQYNPDFFKLLKTSLKKVMLFCANKQNSFATFSAHHMIFINVNLWQNDIYFIDHIAHETSHVIFFTLTHKSKNVLFTCAHTTPFSEVTGVDWEHSNIYLRFHGIFTYLGITDSLLKILNKNALQHDAIHEINGRFVFYMIKYQLSLDRFLSLDIFKDEGRKWLNFFETRYKELAPKFEQLKDRYDFRNQPYVFDSKTFANDNAKVFSTSL